MFTLDSLTNEFWSFARRDATKIDSNCDIQISLTDWLTDFRLLKRDKTHAVGLQYTIGII